MGVRAALWLNFGRESTCFRSSAFVCLFKRQAAKRRDDEFEGEAPHGEGGHTANAQEEFVALWYEPTVVALRQIVVEGYDRRRQKPVRESHSGDK